MDSIDVIDIRNTSCVLPEESLRDEIVHGLAGNAVIHAVCEEGFPIVQWKKSIPTGQFLPSEDICFEGLTFLVQSDELAILDKYGWEIATLLAGPTNPVATLTSPQERLEEDNPGDLHLTVVDLGAGRLDKAECLLRSIDKETCRLGGLNRPAKISTTYCAVDIQYQELRARLCDLLRGNPIFSNGCHEDREGKIIVRGVCGSYLDSLDLLQNDGLTRDTLAFNNGQEKIMQRKCILWLGSSLTNMSLPQASIFLGRFATGVLRAGDTLLVGVDHCRDIKKVKAAYSEESDCWRAYVRNGVKNAGAILGGDAAAKMNGGSNWDYVTRWDTVNGRHMRFVRSRTRVSFEISSSSPCDRATATVEMEEGEYILIAQSYKHSLANVERCFQEAGLDILKRWTKDQSDCSLYLLGKERGI
ncbi:unnamed protein product [Penicillium viridicatum]